MAFTQEQYDKLVENISNGVEEVWYGDKKVKHMKLDDMLRLKGIMETDLGITSNTPRKVVTQWRSGNYGNC